ncbi:hypothetical protein QQS21_007635 [Conoideocrella luteorostrata]|uniref:DUF7730 domain-containing protein n=1 Tax=Conoideocrella luteorostrata TaxID=1105319 RepID=A0AAJ0FWT5_9HYPO|nr:hypothetical protein QQS21_007635 [Conoideocrella luteorostrata]
MKTRIKTWLQRKRGSRTAGQGDGNEAITATDLPFRPGTRPTILTPSPSKEHLAAGSPFFERLPREVRQYILILAFGGRIVHMDLSFVHPVASREPGARPLSSHAGINADDVHSFVPPRVNWDTRRPKSWQWWSSVCHRPLPEHLSSPIDRLRGGAAQPGDDHCRYGAPHNCKLWPGVYPSKCQIGAMGWLLSCRQAYMEGIHALYKTNTIHMSGQILLSHLPQFLLPQRLSEISSIVITCPLKLHRSSNSQVVSEVSHLESLLAMLSSDFHNLARLHLALTADRVVVDPPSLQVVLKVIDEFVKRHKPSLDQFTVSPSRSLFTPLYEATQLAIIERMNVPKLSCIPIEIWRNLDGSHILTEVGSVDEPLATRFSSPYPKPPHATSRSIGGTVGEGYWIVQGDIDDEPPIREMTCS